MDSSTSTSRNGIQVKRDLKAETGGQEQNEAKAKSTAKQNQAKARGGAKKEGNDATYYQAGTEDIGDKNHGILQTETKDVERRVSTCVTCQDDGESRARDPLKPAKAQEDPRSRMYTDHGGPPQDGQHI